VARKDDGELDKKSFPLVSSLFPNTAPPIAGLDNGKVKVLKDYSGYLEKVEQAKKDQKEIPKGPATTLEAELATLRKEEEAGKPVGAKLKESLTKLNEWWNSRGKPNYEVDKKPVLEAKMDGMKLALLYTAFVPAALAVGFLLLMLYFKAIGGYKQLHVEDE
jgi:hypothetical protein